MSEQRRIFLSSSSFLGTQAEFHHWRGFNMPSLGETWVLNTRYVVCKAKKRSFTPKDPNPHLSVLMHMGPVYLVVTEEYADAPKMSRKLWRHIRRRRRL